jgi:hypothetical protein
VRRVLVNGLLSHATVESADTSPSRSRLAAFSTDRERRMTRLLCAGVAPLLRKLFGAPPTGHPWNESILRSSGVHE